MSYRRSTVPAYVSAVYALLEDPDRPLTVGAVTVAAGGLFGPAAWDRYLADLDRKLAQPVGFCDQVGARRALWYAALSGASYASHWFPASAWAAGVASLRAALAVGDFDRVVWDLRYAPPARWAPAVADDAFWAATVAVAGAAQRPPGPVDRQLQPAAGPPRRRSRGGPPSARAARHRTLQRHHGDDVTTSTVIAE